MALKVLTLLISSSLAKAWLIVQLFSLLCFCLILSALASQIYVSRKSTRKM